MKKYCSILLLWFVACTVNGSGLPPEHEVERLLLSLKDSVENSQWLDAKNQLSNMRNLEVAQPSESYYFEGLVKIRTGEFYQARLVLEQYVVHEGSKGKYYKEALKLITEAENSEKKQEVSGNSPKPSLELIDASQRDGYIKSLQALYLTQDPIEALTLQVNSLLSAHPYTGSRIKKSGVKEGLVYQIDVARGVLTLQEKSYRNGAPMLSANSMQVPGLDPFIGAACSNKEYACWLLHPTDKHKPWIKVDYDELAVEELREAMTKLLQALQQAM